MEPWLLLTAVAVVTALCVLLVFRLVSNQPALEKAKDRIQAHILEIRLYKDHPRLLLGAQKKTLRAIAAYLRYAWLPFLILAIPFLLLLEQLEPYFGFRPLRPGERATVELRLDERTSLDRMAVDVTVPEGITVETPGLRIPSQRTIHWRIRALREGDFQLGFRFAGKEASKEVLVKNSLSRVIREARKKTAFSVLLVGRSLSGDSSIEAIRVHYAERRWDFLGWQVHWLVPFFAIVLVAGYALKGLLGVAV